MIPQARFVSFVSLCLSLNAIGRRGRSAGYSILSSLKRKSYFIYMFKNMFIMIFFSFTSSILTRPCICFRTSAVLWKLPLVLVRCHFGRHVLSSLHQRSFRKQGDMNLPAELSYAKLPCLVIATAGRITCAARLTVRKRYTSRWLH